MCFEESGINIALVYVYVMQRNMCGLVVIIVIILDK